MLTVLIVKAYNLWNKRVCCSQTQKAQLAAIVCTVKYHDPKEVVDNSFIWIDDENYYR